MPQFIYFVAHPGNKDLIKEELKLYYPFLLPSFSQGGFLTYKNSGKELSIEQIGSWPITFALEWGLSDFKLEKEIILQKQEVALSKIELPPEAPSRAYLKIAEACEVLGIQANSKLNWAEFGSSPGGISAYLLKNFGKVVGVDPASMNPSILNNRNYTFINNPIQNTHFEQINVFAIDWVISDLNLNPLQAIKEVIRLCAPMRPRLKGILMTIKMTKLEHVKLLPHFERLFSRENFKNFRRIQLPSHKREYLLFVDAK